MSNETEAPTEDVVSKYKRLLTLARSSLEANQATLAAKDKYITELQKALQDEKASKHKRTGGGKDDETYVPRNLLRRVDIEDSIWILVEYEGSEDSWMRFGGEQELNDFVQRIPGVPLSIPQRSFSPAESARIESESRKRVERIVEEFRRYKVRTEIAKKNKDAEAKLAVLRSPSSGMTQSSSGSTLPSLMEKSLTDGTLGDATNMDELQRLKHQLSEQDAKWRQAYEKVVKENELLRTRGGEAVLATQWRERYESVLREKDDLAEKLKIHTSMESRTGGADGPFGPGKTIEQAYADLRDEYRDYRRRVQQAEQQRQNELEGQGSYPAYNMPESFSSGNGSGGVLRSMGMGESKIQYVRHMVFQYLSCKDAIVKPHIESALIALFRYNEMERAAIEEQRKVETQDTITSITNFLGSFTG